MQAVILFAGGDGGGVILTGDGVRPIPPFDPEILGTLRATLQLVAAFSHAQDTDAGQQLMSLATTSAVVAVGLIKDVVGPLQEDCALVYHSDEGGFTCGTTGKRPIHLPSPPSPLAY